MYDANSVSVGGRLVNPRVELQSSALTMFRRILTISASVLYAISIFIAYGTYLHPEWGYIGFTYSPPSEFESLVGLLLVIVVAAVIPSDLQRPSAVVLLFVFALVYVPTVVVTLCLSSDALSRYGGGLIALMFAFILSSVVSNRSLPRRRTFGGYPSVAFIRFILFGWLFLCVFLVAVYFPIMSFANSDQIYEQRARGAATSAVFSYSQTYFSSVFTPTILVLGLVLRNRWLALLGVAGCIVVYMITAQRTLLGLPVVICAFYWLLSSSRSWTRYSALYIFALALSVSLSFSFYETSETMALVAQNLVFRTVALPGLTYSQYFDVFTFESFTWWSHVKGLDLLVGPPSAFASSDLWPGLGYIVGESLYRVAEWNVNANLYASDGLAAAGELGVVLIGIAFALWLRALDYASASWNPLFCVLAVVPISISLTNGPFFTNLLSFGGIFWVMVFALCKTQDVMPTALLSGTTSRSMIN